MHTQESTNYFAEVKIGQTYRVLVAESEELSRKMLDVALSEEGYEVITVTSGRTAMVNEIAANTSISIQRYHTDTARVLCSASG